MAVAALLQDPQLSAIVTLKSSGIERPAQLDGKRYASYAARCVNNTWLPRVLGGFEGLCRPLLAALHCPFTLTSQQPVWPAEVMGAVFEGHTQHHINALPQTMPSMCTLNK